MKETRLIMGMPVTVNVVDSSVTQNDIAAVFDYFISVDETFSTYKDSSEISQINKGYIKKESYSKEMKDVFTLAEKTKKETNGYFDIVQDNYIDPSGLVKGWAIQKASEILLEKGFHNFFIDAGGDVQISGLNESGELWKVGIRNPFNREENVKVVTIKNGGIATSGTAIRGQHIYNPHGTSKSITDIVGMTVIGQSIYDADRFATAAFAMGKKGIHFIESLSDFEGYMIDKNGRATYTTGFEKHVLI
ncbi:MAG TPA: FAD:protein FMN transferase [Candidatus Saccharimonadales bacterium]|nr:FAD:protein FMN transferase [Candidatus Saccharimonadales bacterium]